MGCLYADTHWALLTDGDGQRCLGCFEYGQLMTPASQSFRANWTATAGTKALDVGLGNLPYYFMQLNERSPAAFKLGQAALTCWWQAAGRDLATRRAGGLTSNCAYDEEHFSYPPRSWPATLQAWHDQRYRLERRQSIAMAELLWHQIGQFAREPAQARAATFTLTDPATGALREEIAAPLHRLLPADCRAEFLQLLSADLLRFVQQAGPLTVAGRLYQVANRELTAVALVADTPTVEAMARVEPPLPARADQHAAPPVPAYA